MSRRRLARVVLDSPLPQLDRLFDYAIPDSLADTVAVGMRVRVPLRTAGRVIDAYVVELDDEPDASRALSEVDSVVSPVPVLPPDLYTVARRIADRAAGSVSDILRVAIPKRAVRVEKAWLAASPPAAVDPEPDDVEWARAQLSAVPGLADALVSGQRCAMQAPARPGRSENGSVGAWAEIVAAAAVQTLSAGRSAIIVLPDHRDQEQVHHILQHRLPPTALARHDARQTGPERYGNYLRMLAEAPCVVIGNRSAVYAPARNIGLVAIWDDGDTSLQEPLSPGVHARDAALVRQEADGFALLLAAHTRSTDVQRLVDLGWVTEFTTERKYRPRVVLDAPDTTAPGVRIPSTAYAAARDAVTRGPVLIQVARPGYAPTLVCEQCREPARCAHCGGPLRARAADATPECAWCGRGAHDWACPSCHARQVRIASTGSERTAEDLGRAFPGVRVVVADGDHPVLRVDAKPALVIATRGAEPVASGGYQAVVLLDGERMLLSEDLRVGEACLRWWSNAAALAAENAPVHLVGVTGPIGRTLATWTQPQYAETELRDRAPLRMPPTVRVAALTGAAASVDAAIRRVREAVPELDNDAVLGPVSGPDGARALLRFEYGRGPAVTAALRAAVIASATGRRTPGARGRREPTLKVRVDIPDPEL